MTITELDRSASTTIRETLTSYGINRTIETTLNNGTRHGIFALESATSRRYVAIYCAGTLVFECFPQEGIIVCHRGKSSYRFFASRNFHEITWQRVNKCSYELVFAPNEEYVFEFGTEKMLYNRNTIDISGLKKIFDKMNREYQRCANIWAAAEKLDIIN